MGTGPTDPVPKRRKEEEKKYHHRLPQRENEGNGKERHDLILLRSPNWLNLPSDLSCSILSRISTSIPDLLSFSAVCTSWRSFAKSSFLNSMISLPPLLLSSSADEFHPRRSSMSLLKTLNPTLDPKTFRSSISKQILNRNCCGCSFGHLIFASSSRSNVLIADLFSTAEYRLPHPPPGHNHFSAGILTAPPSSSSSMLFLISSPLILSWRFGADPGDKDWSVIKLVSFHLVNSVAFFNGALHVLHFNGEIFALELDAGALWKRLPDAPGEGRCPYTRLVECDGELLVVRFMKAKAGDDWTHRIEVYKMDFGEGAWVRIQSIGDWCLFMDSIGRCPLACRNPGSWGGESSCIYFAGPRSGSWTLLPLDGTEFTNRLNFFLPIPSNQWASPIWVYPSMLR